jgi:hypothetical protein
MRVQSAHPSNDGGWYHFFEAGKQPVYRPAPKPLPKPLQTAGAMIESWKRTTPESRIDALAITLGVSLAALMALDACWSSSNNAWAFPMKDASGETVGIRLRNEKGEKWAVKGSKSGIFIPRITPTETVITCEGPTSLAACITLGLWGIGRPSCNSCNDEAKAVLKAHGVRRVIIVADFDKKLREDGTEWSPGIEGAERFGQMLKMPYVVYVPPTKDIRDFLKAGGTKRMFENSVNQMVWRR